MIWKRHWNFRRLHNLHQWYHLLRNVFLIFKMMLRDKVIRTGIVSCISNRNIGENCLVSAYILSQRSPRLYQCLLLIIPTPMMATSEPLHRSRRKWLNSSENAVCFIEQQYNICLKTIWVRNQAVIPVTGRIICPKNQLVWWWLCSGPMNIKCMNDLCMCILLYHVIII